MERRYRASNAIFIYAGLLVFTALLLGIEAIQQFRGGAINWGALLAVLAISWLGAAGVLVFRWGRLMVTVRSDLLHLSGHGLERRAYWSDVARVREFRGPAYQLAIRGLLPGPYLPLGLLRDETVLEVVARPGVRILIRQALVDGYGSVRQDILSSVPRETEIDLHARWWHADGSTDGAGAMGRPPRTRKDRVAGGD
jgi:hypothetical protein